MTIGVLVELLNMTNRGGLNSGRRLLVSFRWDCDPKTDEERGVSSSDATTKRGPPCRRLLNSPLCLKWASREREKNNERTRRRQLRKGS